MIKRSKARDRHGGDNNHSQHGSGDEPTHHYLPQYALSGAPFLVLYAPINTAEGSFFVKPYPIHSPAGGLWRSKLETAPPTHSPCYQHTDLKWFKYHLTHMIARSAGTRNM